MKKKKFAFFKAPIMAVVVVARLIPGIPTYNNRFIFYIAIVLPFIPIFNFASKLENETISNVVICYFLFYVISSVLFTHGIKKLGKQWSAEEYNSLKADQITFPFILVILVNASAHFGLFYFISSCFI